MLTEVSDIIFASLATACPTVLYQKPLPVTLSETVEIPYQLNQFCMLIDFHMMSQIALTAGQMQRMPTDLRNGF